MFIIACTNHTIWSGPTGLPITRPDHREDVRKQHQSHLCCNQPCGSFVPGQELRRSHWAHVALHPLRAPFDESKSSVLRWKLRGWQVWVVNLLVLNILSSWSPPDLSGFKQILGSCIGRMQTQNESSLRCSDIRDTNWESCYNWLLVGIFKGIRESNRK